ncbi:uncharacterized protein LOC111345786 [Stylophora pistillata]|uniref:uncharacterized protein LOC111345786 n=1 Tax=Stylophora pistillata TaxID=50429 RepID=UPI000C0495E5|nr:uncharacterized protein LOC111345786 [Stylophora pistillata]
MNTLLLVLFFGGSVALAELPFEDSAIDKLLDVEGEEITGDLDLEVENDPLKPSGRPSLPLKEKVCKCLLRICSKCLRPTPPELTRDEFSDENDAHRPRPSGRPQPTGRPRCKPRPPKKRFCEWCKKRLNRCKPTRSPL